MRHVCVITGSHFSARAGGAQFQAKCLVDLLKGTTRVTYIARSIDPAYRPEGYELLRLPPRGHSFLFDADRLYRLLRRLRPDSIYQRAIGPDTGVAAYYAKRAGCRFVAHIASDHSLTRRKPSRLPGLRALEGGMSRYGLRNCSSIVAQTRYQAEIIRRDYGREAIVVRNFHPFVDGLPNKPDDEFRVVWVSNFKKVKQPELFVRLAEDLRKHANLRFFMIGHPGNGNYAGLQERIARAHNLSYPGKQPVEKVNAELALAHLFVNTSIDEGFANTFVQAWMHKVPVLSLNVNPDGLLSGDIGICAGSYERLRDTVIELASDRARRERMGESARAYAIAHHSPKAAETLVALLST